MLDNNSSSFHTDNYKNSVLFLGGGDMFVIEPNLVMCACGGGGGGEGEHCPAYLKLIGIIKKISRLVVHILM